MKKKRKSNYLTNVNFVGAFKDSVSSMNDCLSDFSETLVDSLIDNPIVRAIPILKLVTSAYKGAKSFYAYFQQKKLVMFLGTLHSCTDDASLNKMRNKMLNDRNYLFKESELTLAVLEKTTESEKSIILAECFAALIKEEISEEIYFELVLIIDRIFLSDLDVLKKVKDGKNDEVSSLTISSLNRLNAAGLTYLNTFGGGVAYNHYTLTDIGEKLCRILIKLSNLDK